MIANAVLNEGPYLIEVQVKKKYKIAKFEQLLRSIVYCNIVEME